MLSKTREANTRLARALLPAVIAGYHRGPMSTERFRPSVTVAAIVERGGRYLLVEEHTPEGLRMNNPAGHLEPGESPLQGVVREALEETACQFEVEALVGVYLARMHRLSTGEDVTYLRFAFCGTVGEPEPGRALDHGIVRTLWLTPQEVEASRERHRSPLVWQCIADHAAGRRYPLQLLSIDPSVYAAGSAG
jgi:8-oxo-dGTP pyrophosphatase MutT (NUDIX family)